MKRLFMIIIAGAMLSACARLDTGSHGSSITDAELANPAGQNSFSVTFAPNGIPETVRISQGKDEQNVSLKTAYLYPDGTSSTWEYAVGESKGSTQTTAIATATEAIAAIEAETGQKLGSGALDVLVPLLKTALAAP